MTLRLATPPGATSQAQWVAEQLTAAGTQVSISVMNNGSGDPMDAFGRGDAALALVPGRRLLYRRRDTHPILAALSRLEPRDVLVVGGGRSTPLRALPPGSRVGVTGARRRAFLRLHRPDLEVVSLTKGNTPASALESGLVDAAILSVVEARRVGLGAMGAEVLDPKEWLPEPAQGSFALVGARELESLPGLDRVDHKPSRMALEAELILMDTLSVPAGSAIGALAQPTGRWLRLWAAAASEDGAAMVRSDLTGPHDAPRDVAEAVAHQMVERGLATILATSAP